MPYTVTSKTLANVPKTSICSPDAVIRPGMLPSFACVFRDISFTAARAPGGRRALERAGGEN